MSGWRLVEDIRFLRAGYGERLGEVWDWVVVVH